MRRRALYIKVPRTLLLGSSVNSNRSHPDCELALLGRGSHGFAGLAYRKAGSLPLSVNVLAPRMPTYSHS
jgi:hypothetical protein